MSADGAWGWQVETGGADLRRTILVARELVEREAEIVHILADGRTELHDETLKRLFDLERIPQQDLFSSREQLRDRAYAAREERIAYVSTGRSRQRQKVAS